MTGYVTDREFSDRFLDHVAACLGLCFITPATYQEDTKENTDLKWFDIGKTRLAARTRKPFDRFGKLATARFMPDFTIRCARRSGAKTELEKIREGLGDFLFYGIVSEDESHIAHWAVVDLSVFRAVERLLVPDERTNADRGGSSFRAYKTTDLGPTGVRAVYAWPLAVDQYAHANVVQVVPTLKVASDAASVAAAKARQRALDAAIDRLYCPLFGGEGGVA